MENACGERALEESTRGDGAAILLLKRPNQKTWAKDKEKSGGKVCLE